MTRLIFFLTVLAAGCPGTQEAVTVELPVTTVATAIPAATTDLGYEVQVTRIRIAVAELQFTVEGETHAIAPPPGTVLHPGHSAGGEPTGELPGDYILTWDGQPQEILGLGTLLAGDYTGANFGFRAASELDGLTAGDALLGHAFHLTGTVTREGVTTPFDAVLDVEPATQVVGAVFEHTITETSTETLAIGFFPVDPEEGDTAFDGVEFSGLPASAGTLEIRPGGDAHNILRRAIQTHDHYGVFAR